MFAPEFELIIIADGAEIARHAVKLGAYVIGREPGCEILIDSVDLSRHHAKLTVNESGCVIEDLGSRNGTLLDGRRVTTLARFAPGQQVQLGSVSLELCTLTESGAGEGVQRTYAAFLSYRHADNRELGRQWATWLHQAIETYEVPSDLVGTRNDQGEEIPARIFPVFRDEEELPADADLSTPIVRALENSSYLVVLCSPGAAASRFVADEILRFKAMGKSDRVVAAIISGEPNVTTDAAKQAVGWTPEQECFPEPLRYEVEANGSISGRPAEPIAADFRLEDCSEGWTSPEAYRESLKGAGLALPAINHRVEAYAKRLTLMKLKVLAGILGVPLGMLTKRDQAYQLEQARQRARILRRWLAALIGLVLAAITAGAIAMIQKAAADSARVAEAKQRQAAEAAQHKAEDSQRRAAEAQRLAEESNRKADEAGRSADEARKNELTTKQTSSEKRKLLLQEAARSDRLVASDLAKQGDQRAALAYLARALQYDPEDTLAVELALKELSNWKFPAAILMLQHHADEDILHAQFTPDGQCIVTVAIGRKVKPAMVTVRVWGADSGKQLANFQKIAGDFSEGEAEPLLSPDCRQIVTFSARNVGGKPQVWEVSSGRLLATFQDLEKARYAYFAFNGQRIGTVDNVSGSRVWNSSSGKLLSILPTNDGPGEFSRDGKRIVMFSGPFSNGQAQVWEAESAKLVTTLKTEAGMRAAHFSPDGRHVVTISSLHTAQIWAVSGVFGVGGELLATIQGHTDYLTDVQFSPDGQRIVTASADKSARVWKADTKSLGSARDGVKLLLATLQGHTGAVNSPRFSPDGQRIITNSYDETTKLVEARVWEASSGKLLAVLGGHEGFSAFAEGFSPDGQRIVAVSSGGVSVWEVSSGKLLVTFQGDKGSPPPWFADFLRLMAQRKFNDNGELVTMPTADTVALRVKLEGNLAIEHSHYAAIARSFLNSVDQRPASAAKAPVPGPVAPPAEVAKLEPPRPVQPPPKRAVDSVAAATKGAPFVNSLGMEFVPVAGTKVLFSVRETRVQDYLVFTKADLRAWGKKWEKPSFETEYEKQGPTHPAVNVSWEDAKAFCVWLSKREGREYRLPTDAEWSVAVGLGPEAGNTPAEKSGKTPGYWWGSAWPPPAGAGNYAEVPAEKARKARARYNYVAGLVDGHANIPGYDDGYANTSPVGSFAPNALGIYDLSGNVWEWCEDLYDAKQPRVLRGGSWDLYSENDLRSSYRFYADPSTANDNRGFRCVLVVPGG